MVLLDSCFFHLLWFYYLLCDFGGADFCNLSKAFIHSEQPWFTSDCANSALHAGLVSSLSSHRLCFLPA